MNYGGVLVKAKDTGRVFLMLRQDGGTCPLTWGMISGGIESNELILDGIKREVFEECQIDPEIIEYHFIHKEFEKEGYFYYYEGLTDSEFTPTLDFENIDWGWFDKTELPQPLYPKIINKIENI